MSSRDSAAGERRRGHNVLDQLKADVLESLVNSTMKHEPRMSTVSTDEGRWRKKRNLSTNPQSIDKVSRFVDTASKDNELSDYKIEDILLAPTHRWVAKVSLENTRGVECQTGFFEMLKQWEGTAANDASESSGGQDNSASMGNA